jgi:hypothetical protein
LPSLRAPSPTPSKQHDETPSHPQANGIRGGTGGEIGTKTNCLKLYRGGEQGGGGGGRATHGSDRAATVGRLSCDPETASSLERFIQPPCAGRVPSSPSRERKPAPGSSFAAARTNARTNERRRRRRICGFPRAADSAHRAALAARGGERGGEGES